MDFAFLASFPSMILLTPPAPRRFKTYHGATPGLSFVEHLSLKNNRANLRFERDPDRRQEMLTIIWVLQCKHERYMAAHPELVEKERVEEALAEVRRKEKAVRERVLVFVRWVTAERIKLLREFEGAGEGGGGRC